NQIWRAGEYKSNRSAKAESLHNRGKEVLESVCGKVHMLHKGKDPESVVLGCFFKTFKGRALGPLANRVANNSSMSKFSLLRCKPPSLQWIIRECEYSSNSDNKGNNT